MGMIAYYMGVEKDIIEDLKCKSNEDLFDEIESLEEEDIEMYDMDKLWDGLHFVLTGASADKPIENNLLSSGNDYLNCATHYITIPTAKPVYVIDLKILLSKIQ